MIKEEFEDVICFLLIIFLIPLFPFIKLIEFFTDKEFFYTNSKEPSMYY